MRPIVPELAPRCWSVRLRPPLSQAQPIAESFSSVWLLDLSRNSFSGIVFSKFSAATAFRLGTALRDPALECWASWQGARESMGNPAGALIRFDPFFPGWPDYKYVSCRRQAGSHSFPSLLLRCAEHGERMVTIRFPESDFDSRRPFLYGHQSSPCRASRSGNRSGTRNRSGDRP